MEKKNLENIKALLKKVTIASRDKFVPDDVLNHFLSVEPDREQLDYVFAMRKFRPSDFIRGVTAYIEANEQLSVLDVIMRDGPGILFECQDESYQYVGVGKAGEHIFRKLGRYALVVDEIDLSLPARAIF